MHKKKNSDLLITAPDKNFITELSIIPECIAIGDCKWYLVFIQTLEGTYIRYGIFFFKMVIIE